MELRHAEHYLMDINGVNYEFTEPSFKQMKQFSKAGDDPDSVCKIIAVCYTVNGERKPPDYFEELPVTAISTLVKGMESKMGGEATDASPF